MSTQKPNIYHANICPPCPKTATFFEKCIYALGIGLGSGKPRRAAGTWGTLFGLIIGVVLANISVMGFWIMTAIGLIVGNYICGKTSNLMQIEDDPHIVFDEWVGMWIALIPMSVIVFYGYDYSVFDSTNHNFRSGIFMIIASFGLFRLFDIIKPPPIGLADKYVSGGFGIMLDDVLAGIMAAGVWLMGFVIIY